MVCFERDEVDHKTAVYVLFCVIPSKIWKKNLLLQIKGVHCKNTEELQKLFKYFAILYSVEKKIRSCSNCAVHNI